jgi:Chaperone of endosialidase
MRSVPAASATILCLSLISTSTALAQTAATGPSAAVPRVINLAGVFQPVDGQPLRAVETVTLALYADPTGGTPLWQETQSVAVDTKGGYTLLLGAASAEGIPAAVVAAGAQWLGTTFDRPGEVEGPRVQLTSMPYALRAADADTLGGRPATAYLLAPGATGKGGTATTAGQASAHGLEPGAPPAPDVVQPGTVNFLAKYVTAADVGNSALYETNGAVGLGTTTPSDLFHVRFTNTTGGLTGLAVQNLGNTTASYSGMLFYDQNGALGQFQGFNNVTHEYRINNIASAGSINFMLGSASKFLVAPNGNIGIGTTSPSALLEVSNAVPGGPANVWTTSFTNALGPYYLARRSRGTAAAPTAAQTGDGLSGLYGQGYGTTQFGPGNGGITVQAAQNFTDTQQGTALTFSTTPINSVTPSTRMTIDATGFLGIGTTTTPAAGVLEASNAGNIAPFGSITGSSFTGTNPAGTLFLGRKARGTSAAPTAVQNGDNLVGFLGEGYGATAFSLTRGGMFVRAAENWTDTAQGTALNFNTTAIGTNTPGTKMVVDPAGNVGIGTLNPVAQLEVSSTGSDATVVTSAFNNGGAAPVFFTRHARGTPAAPTATQSGDPLGVFATSGYGATQFNELSAGFGAAAAENWTDAAQGSLLGFFTTALGTNTPQLHLGISASGNVGIGTWPLNGVTPTAADTLQVFGDIRVGTTGTNGCLRNFAGTGIAGSCASDRRFKRNITPFGPVLSRFAALQPVRYYWRAAEFPDQHFGDMEAYGLIAQDVEQVLPELVVTRTDGYKAVDYSELPMLTIQAVKELKAENDELKRRLADVERVLADMVVKSTRR